MTNVSASSATLTWTDAINSSWEYAVVAANANAPTTGSSTNNKTITPTQTTGTGAAALQPNTEYDFYVRSSCGGANRSKWVVRFVLEPFALLSTLLSGKGLIQVVLVLIVGQA